MLLLCLLVEFVFFDRESWLLFAVFFEVFPLDGGASSAVSLQAFPFDFFGKFFSELEELSLRLNIVTVYDLDAIVVIVDDAGNKSSEGYGKFELL